MRDRPATVGGEVPEAPSDETAAPAATEPGGGAAAPPEGTGERTRPARRPPALPTARTATADRLETKTVLLYGPAGIGKTTLASEWGDGEVFFFNTAGELDGFEVYQQPIPDWKTFREYGWALAEDPGRFSAWAIDTADVLGTVAAAENRRKLGLVHESDADWGKGWTLLREMVQLQLAKLALIPGMGGILISHAKDEAMKIETRSRKEEWIKQVPTLTGGVREAVLNMADLVLFLDWDDTEEGSRVIRTKGSKYWEAKERGPRPRLPEAIPWPFGRSGYDVLREAWEKGAES